MTQLLQDSPGALDLLFTALVGLGGVWLGADLTRRASDRTRNIDLCADLLLAAQAALETMKDVHQRELDHVYEDRHDLSRAIADAESKFARALTVFDISSRRSPIARQSRLIHRAVNDLVEDFELKVKGEQDSNLLDQRVRWHFQVAEAELLALDRMARDAFAR